MHIPELEFKVDLRVIVNFPEYHRLNVIANFTDLDPVQTMHLIKLLPLGFLLDTNWSSHSAGTIALILFIFRWLRDSFASIDNGVVVFPFMRRQVRYSFALVCCEPAAT